MKCTYCKEDVQPNCTWNQGRCPHQSVVNQILVDNYKARYYNLLTSIKNLFKK